MSTSPLSEKQKRFCDEYLIDLNATQAAIRAGYSKKTANEQASRLLTKVSIQNYLQTKRKAIEAKTDITLERTLRQIARLAFQDARSYFDAEGQLIPIHKLSDDAAAALAGFDVEELYEYQDGQKNQIGFVKKIKRYDSTKALEMLMRHLGGFETDNSQKKTDVVVPLSDDQVTAIIKKMNGTSPAASRQVQKAG